MKVTVRFLRHDGICRPMCSCFKSLDRSTAFRPGSAQAVKDAPEVLRPTHRRDEFRPAIPQRGARQQSPPPLHRHAHPKSVPGSATIEFTANGQQCLQLFSQPRGPPHTALQVIHKADPEYTPEALEAKLVGAVTLSVVIDAEGNPTGIKVIKGLGKGLDEKAVECLQKWHFKPATNNSEPVSAKATVEIEFRLPPLVNAGVASADSQLPNTSAGFEVASVREGH